MASVHQGCCCDETIGTCCFYGGDGIADSCQRLSPEDCINAGGFWHNEQIAGTCGTDPLNLACPTSSVACRYCQDRGHGQGPPFIVARFPRVEFCVNYAHPNWQVAEQQVNCMYSLFPYIGPVVDKGPADWNYDQVLTRTGFDAPNVGCKWEKTVQGVCPADGIIYAMTFQVRFNLNATFTGFNFTGTRNVGGPGESFSASHPSQGFFPVPWTCNGIYSGWFGANPIRCQGATDCASAAALCSGGVNPPSVWRVYPNGLNDGDINFG